MTVPPPDEGFPAPVPVTVETVLGPRVFLYALHCMPLLLSTFLLREYVEHGTEAYLGFFLLFLMVLVLHPALCLRFLPGMVARRRFPTRSRRMEGTLLGMLWAGTGLLLLVGVRDVMAGVLPWPVLVPGLAAFVFLVLGTEAHARDWWRGR
ncbi:hypothetical protein A6A08_07915 [Nocardiopsis sp. TSRI0078]|uniref:hypothetical protein n=1 Tax=unclassified Nocardiopsis TaxID=2649073 RepID=UPI000938EC59|nr:hypothetical protein [Nocardiopsis sp. TSRI0078]OKI17169.1 hypothetical protein A6A08_07915 [Nocardiopsis sp. TSRI0078]